MKLGLAFNNLGPSQLAYHFTVNATKLLEEGVGVDVICFYQDLQRTALEQNFAMMQMAEAYGFDGTLVATSFSTAKKTLQLPTPTKKAFYVWDLEWLRMKKKDFRSLQQVYGNPELLLIARSEDHARVLENAWNRKVSLITDNCDLRQMLKL